MKKLIAVALVLVLALSLVACSSETNNTQGNKDVKIGVILVHDENTGYDEAHINGIKKALENCGIPNDTDHVVWKYNVPEDEKCHDAATELVEAGCTYIFSDSYGHQPYMQQAATENPDVVFASMTGDTAALSGLKNFKNAFCNTYESRYVSGVVAGMKLQELVNDGKVAADNMDENGNIKLGYVGAYPYAEVVSGYTAFFLGVQSIVPNVVMDVLYTSSWFDPVAEGEAANTLMSRGCIIISQHADSTGAPSAVQAKYEAGETVFSVGYNIDMLSVAPDVALTSPQNNWGSYYTYAFEQVMNGKKPEQDWCHGYSNNAVQISPLGKACAAGTQEAVDAAIEKIKSGELKVFDCSTFTVNGEHLTGYDKSHGFEGTQLIWDGYFHESEVISAPLFDIRIDGITELSK